jgi:hypothetical protein
MINRDSMGQLLLVLLALTYIMMLGGGMYEQLNVTPKIAAVPPQSLAMLQGPYGFNPVKFWGTFRPLTILLFILTIAVNWKKNAQRNFLLAAFAIDIVVTLSTFLYFAPETGVIASTPFSATDVNEEIQARAQRWMNLNWLRIGGFAMASSLILATITNLKSAGRN